MARPAKHPIKKVVGFDAALLERVRDFRFGQRIASENEAIRRLIEAGLNAQAGAGSGGKRPDVQGKGLQPTTLGRSGPGTEGAPSPSPKKPRAKPAATKEAQIQAVRERSS